MRDLKGKIAAITGAASGIGRALAVGLASEGCHTAISDIDGKGLQETARLIDGKGVNVTTHIVDVSSREQMHDYADDVISRHGSVHIIINNAGVCLMDMLESVSYEDLEWIMGVNVWGVIHGTKAFLPYLKKEKEAHIVNVSSVNGMVTNPGNGPYCTTKYAIRGFTETLQQELKDTPVRVSCVHPGGIATNIGRNSRFRRAAIPDMSHDEAVAVFEELMVHNSADEAAKIIIRGMKKNKPCIMVGGDAHIFDLMKRAFPLTTQKMLSSRKMMERVKNKIRSRG